MTVRTHLFPFRTQKLSSLVPKIVRWKRRVKIGSRRLLYGPLVKRLRQRPLTPLTSVRFRYGSPYAPLAQLVEQLTLNQWAQGSSPGRCTNKRALNRRIQRSFFYVRKRLHTFCTPFAHLPELRTFLRMACTACFPLHKTRTCRGEAPPSAIADRSVTQTPHWGFHCSAPLRKRELLKTRHFRQLARKSKENFGKKREGWTVPALLTKNKDESCIETQCKGI